MPKSRFSKAKPSVGNYRASTRAQHLKPLVALCATAGVPLFFYESCGTGTSIISESTNSSVLDDALAQDPAALSLSWFYSLPQEASAGARADNVLALQKIEASDEIIFSLQRRLNHVLPALKADLQIAADASADERGAFDFLSQVLEDKQSAQGETAIVTNTALDALAERDSAEQAQTILEFLASVPVEDDEPRELRARVIMLLGQSALSDSFTIQTLNLMARGVGLSKKGPVYASYESNLAARAIQFIVSRMQQSYIAPHQASAYRLGDDVASAVEDLKTAKIVRIKGVGKNKGINDTKIVTFESPSGEQTKYLYKPAIGTEPFSAAYFDANPNDFLNFINFTREARAAHFHHLVLDRLAEIDPKYQIIFSPVTLEAALYHDGVSYGLGSLQKFLDEGYTDIVESQSEQRNEWNGQVFHSDEWRSSSVVVKVLDFMFGNNDRLLVPGVKDDFDKNLMVKFLTGQFVLSGVALIDNGIGIPGRDWYTPDRLVSTDHIPGEVKQALREQVGELDEMLAGEVHYFVPWGLRDYRKRYHQVLDRIGR